MSRAEDQLKLFAGDSVRPREDHPWPSVPLRDVGSVMLGRQRNPSAATGADQTPYLRVANVYDGWVDYSDVLTMSFSPAERRTYYLQPGDILLNEGQSLELVGRSAIYEGPADAYCFQNTLVRFRCGPTLDPRFARAVFKLWLDTRRFVRIARQTTSIAHLGADRFARLSIQLPPLPEQRRIAEILDTLDEAIRKTEQVIAKLQQAKQGLLHDLLTRGIDENGEVRDPERHPDQFTDSPIGVKPVAWELSDVEREFEVEAGLTLGQHRRPANNPWPYLRVANVYRGRLWLGEVLSLEARPQERSGKSLRPGDLLVVEGHANPEEIGRCAMATPEVTGFTFQNHLFRLRPRRLSTEFALHWMNGHYVRSYWRRLCSTSSGLNTINRTKLSALRVAVPSPDEQREIEERVASLAARADSEAECLGKLKALRTGLMDDLLTGRVRVKVPAEAKP